MKKLLSLLSVLTISGTAVPTTIAANSYDKKEQFNELNNNNKTSRFKKHINNLNSIDLYFINKDNFNVRKINEIINSVNDIAIYSIDIGKKLANSVYFATNNGLYFMNNVSWTPHKINGINEAVVSVTIAPVSGNAYAITKTGQPYFISNTSDNYDAKKITEILDYVNYIAVYQNDVSDNVKSGSVYFATNNGLYFMGNDSRVQKINGINEAVVSVTIAPVSGNAYAITKTGQSYFITHNDFNARQINELTSPINSIAVYQNDFSDNVKSGSVYFATNNGLYFMNNVSWTPHKINGINEAVVSVTIAPVSGNAYAITKTGQSYFITHNDFNVRQINELTSPINSIAVYQNDVSDNVKSGSVYFATNNGLYFMNNVSWTPHKINGINEAVVSVIIAPVSGNAYAITKKVNLNNIITNYELNLINNSDEEILNELNYLNPDLDISQLEIINKTNNLINIKIKNKFNNDVNVINVKYSINNESNKIVNFNELIKKAIFFKFRGENSNLKFKEIKYIDSNNLNFSNVEVTKKSKLLTSIDFKYPCSDKEIVNRTSNSKLFYVPGCEYNSKSELTFQIRKGIIKNQEKNQENIWTLNSDDENKLIDFTYWNDKDVEIINTLSNDFVFSNLNEQKKEMILNMFREPDSRFELNPNEKLKTNYSVRINKSEIILNLKQKITGNISAKIIDDNNKEKTIILSIKEAIQILRRYNLLPDEININKDNSITFNGEAFFSFKREGQLKTSINTFVV